MVVSDIRLVGTVWWWGGGSTRYYDTDQHKLFLFVSYRSIATKRVMICFTVVAPDASFLTTFIINPAPIYRTSTSLNVP